MDDQGIDRKGGVSKRPSKWWVAIPIALSAAAIRGPVPIFILIAVVAWIYWAVIYFRQPRERQKINGDATGCVLSALGAVTCLIAFAIGFGDSMAPGGPSDEWLLIPIAFGGILMVVGLVLFAV